MYVHENSMNDISLKKTVTTHVHGSEKSLTDCLYFIRAQSKCKRTCQVQCAASPRRMKADPQAPASLSWPSIAEVWQDWNRRNDGSSSAHYHPLRSDHRGCIECTPWVSCVSITIGNVDNLTCFAYTLFLIPSVWLLGFVKWQRLAWNVSKLV